MSVPAADPTFDALLEFLKRARGFDFSGYKRASLERRIRRRLEAIGCESYGNYLDYLEVHPDEYEQLFDILLINVTEFFRDPPAWEHLRADVLPGLLESSGEAPLRVWSAGCASGEEAYTIAIVLAEALGVDAFRERVKIYATDVDDGALAVARQAVYTGKALEAVPEDIRERYFEPSEAGLAFRKDLRRTVVIGRNNLMTDAPISRLDLLVCRNTLMYFNADAQAQILRQFHFALRDHGALMLGKSEMMISHRDVFTAVDLKRRIYRKTTRSSGLTPRVAGLANGDPARPPSSEDERASRDAALELGPHAQILVSRSGVLTFANLPARVLFGLAPGDVGRRFSELDISFRPAELRAPVERALRERQRIAVGEVNIKPQKGEQRTFAVSVTPLLSGGPLAHGAAVVFEDVTRRASLQRELDGSRHDLEQAYEELQSTIDELETTNEELQSANEELQTTNEELQSTNEELETMNEELRSTNDELETINDELRDRTGELNHVNEFLESILTSLGIGVAVIDRDERVQIWNDRAEDLWGVRSDEAVEQPLLSLDIGLPIAQIGAGLHAVLGGESDRERAVIEAVNRRGQAIACTTTILPLLGAGGVAPGTIRGAIVLMEDGAGSAERA